MNPGKKNSDLLKNTGIHFLEFALGFLSGKMPLPAKPGYESQLASIFRPDRARQLGGPGLYHV